MVCGKCGEPAQTSTGRFGLLCKVCFSAAVEKRVRREIWFEQGTDIRIFDDGTLKPRVVVHVLQQILQGPWNITLTTSKDANVIANSVDDESAMQFEAVLRETVPVHCVKPLRALFDEEIIAYARMHGIAGRIGEKTFLQQCLDDVEKDYPGSKFGLMKSLQD